MTEQLTNQPRGLIMYDQTIDLLTVAGSGLTITFLLLLWLLVRQRHYHCRTYEGDYRYSRRNACVVLMDQHGRVVNRTRPMDIGRARLIVSHRTSQKGYAARVERV